MLIHFLYASTSGHTEHVVETVRAFLATQAPEMSIEVQRAEQASVEDLLRGDLLILGSGTWNTGGHEGQLNMHMDALFKRAAGIDLTGKRFTFLSLGDERYYFRTRCTEHFLRFVREHGGTLFHPPLVLVNEPYGQEDKIEAWAGKLLAKLRPAPHS